MEIFQWRTKAMVLSKVNGEVIFRNPSEHFRLASKVFLFYWLKRTDKKIILSFDHFLASGLPLQKSGGKFNTWAPEKV